MTDWIENSNNGEGPTPHSSILREDYELLRAVAQERDLVEARLAQTVAQVHGAGASWTTIGAALGMTRQGAHKKYATT